ncbi:outer membrane protein transport protein [Thermomonas sp.]|uniref:OmpP1/FadL family transporter n=1 Tax=Thermomonas sp. TaxID=1971895 RepID=UPI002488FBEB|nr:outer membrane protein transport protein [Thermomonas sp.]MDI1252759.1 outer membrane protein transport protein [Thermomonas sp.]
MKTNSRSFRVTALALAVLGTLAASQASASGFQLRENSAKALGRAGAGSAVAKDAAVVSNNPAAMAQFDKLTMQSDLTVIDLNAKFTGSSCTPVSATVCVPIGGGNGGDPGAPTLVPAMAVVIPLSGSLERLTVGASISAPFGLSTEYDPTWVGRYNATKSEVKTPALTLSAAYKVTPTFSLGVGFIYQRTEVTLANGVDFGRLLAAAGVPGGTIGNPVTDGSVSITGADNGTGWVAGMQFTPNDQFSIGYSHRSEITHNIKGQADFTVPAAFLGAQPGFRAVAAAYAQLPANDPRRAAIPQLLVLGNGFSDTGGNAKLTTPSIDTVSVQYNASNVLRLYGDIQRTGWTSLPSVVIDFVNPYQPDSAEPFNWKNTMFYSVGVEYDLNEAFTIRGGIAKDESPTNNIDRTPRLPDNNRQLYSVGFSWHASEHISIDAAYQKITIDKPNVNILSSSGSRLTGSFDGSANLYSVGASYKF